MSYVVFREAEEEEKQPVFKWSPQLLSSSTAVPHGHLMQQQIYKGQKIGSIILSQNQKYSDVDDEDPSGTSTNQF